MDWVTILAIVLVEKNRTRSRADFTRAFETDHGLNVFKPIGLNAHLVTISNHREKVDEQAGGG